MRTQQRRPVNLNKSSHRKTRRSGIASALLRWYREHGRELPWRNERDPYRILISEVMLQQTQVSRVLTKYPEFLKRFPTFHRLANARISDVIKAWRGMGYNNRALRLQNLARTVVNTLGGTLPENIAALRNLPGIGRYTAHALACFAFGEQVPVVDTNVARVLSRLYPIRKPPAGRLQADLWGLAAHQLPRTNAHDWNQALMDLGATVCTASNPSCHSCPLRGLCPSAHKVRRRSTRSPKREPGRDGIPNRIYRGRAVEVLRNLEHDGSITSSRLARKIKTDFSVSDRRWFDLLLRNLERDGLVRIRGRYRISLPD